MREFADRMYLHAKIHGLRHTILSGPSYRDVLTTRTFNKIPIEIRNQPGNFSSLFTLEENIFRKQVETLLKLLNISKYYRRLFRAYLHVFETWNVKALLMRAEGRYEGDIPWFDISPYNLLSSSFRNEILDRKGLVSRLPEQYKIVFSEVASSQRYEQVEIALDMSIYRELIKSMKCLRPEDAGILAESLLLNITLLSLTWKKRLEVLYRWDRASARSFVDGMAEVLWQSHPLLKKRYPAVVQYWERNAPFLSAHLRPGDYLQLREGEQAMHRKLYTCYLSWFFRDFHAAWCVVSFLWLLYYQLQNLRGMVEGLRADMHPDRIINMLVYGE